MIALGIAMMLAGGTWIVFAIGVRAGIALECRWRKAASEQYRREHSAPGWHRPVTAAPAQSRGPRR